MEPKHGVYVSGHPAFNCGDPGCLLPAAPVDDAQSDTYGPETIRAIMRRLGTIEVDVQATRESQERTEALVRSFVDSMSKNPMLKAMAGGMGRMLG